MGCLIAIIIIFVIIALLIGLLNGDIGPDSGNYKREIKFDLRNGWTFHDYEDDDEEDDNGVDILDKDGKKIK